LRWDEEYRYSGICVNRFSDIFVRKYSCPNSSGAPARRQGEKKPANAGMEDAHAPAPDAIPEPLKAAWAAAVALAPDVKKPARGGLL
jgi:hypothetical protein